MVDQPLHGDTLTKNSTTLWRRGRKVHNIFRSEVVRYFVFQEGPPIKPTPGVKETESEPKDGNGMSTRDDNEEVSVY